MLQGPRQHMLSKMSHPAMIIFQGQRYFIKSESIDNDSLVRKRPGDLGDGGLISAFHSQAKDFLAFFRGEPANNAGRAKIGMSHGVSQGIVFTNPGKEQLQEKGRTSSTLKPTKAPCDIGW